MAFALRDGARLSLLPLTAGTFTARAAWLMLRTAQSLPPNGAFDAGLRPGPFPARPPACYRAPWRLPGPDFHRLATTSLRLSQITS